MPTTAQSRQAALESDYAPLYVVAGLADIALETVKTTVNRQIADVRTRQTELTNRARARQAYLRSNAEGALKLAGDLPTQLKTLPEQLRQLPEVAKAQLAQAQKQAGVSYADFAGRGKVAVDEAILSAKKLQAEASSRATKLADDVVGAAADMTDAVDDAAEQAKGSTAGARATAARKAGGATTAAKKSTTTRKPTTRKAAAAKAAAK